MGLTLTTMQNPGLVHIKTNRGKFIIFCHN